MFTVLFYAQIFDNTEECLLLRASNLDKTVKTDVNAKLSESKLKKIGTIVSLDFVALSSGMSFFKNTTILIP